MQGPYKVTYTSLKCHIAERVATSQPKKGAFFQNSKSGFKSDLCTKAITYVHGPKMKRDASVKVVFFLSVVVRYSFSTVGFTKTRAFDTKCR